MPGPNMSFGKCMSGKKIKNMDYSLQKSEQNN